jgi:ribonuclease HI
VVDTLFVLLDTSTKPTSKTNKYGNTTTAWVARWNKPSNPVVRADIQFLYHEGPNKAFYDGIIRALETLYHMCHSTDRIVIYGDCKLVIDQLNSHPPASSSLTPFWNQIQKIVASYRCPVEFIYMPRTNSYYQEVDQMAKRARGFFNHSIKKN